MIKIIKTGARYNGSILYAGESRQLQKADEDRIIASGHAESIDIQEPLKFSVTGVKNLDTLVYNTANSKFLPGASRNEHPRYFCHLWAGAVLADETRANDISGAKNHAVRGANLSAAQMTASAGYISTIDPAGGALDSVLHMPAVNLDLVGGESMLIWWLGKVTAEGGDETLIGDSVSTSNNGWRIRARSSGKVDFVAYQNSGALSAFSGSSTATLIDGTLHSFAFFLDGKNGTIGKWEDGVNTVSATPFAAGYNTKTTGGVAIGAGRDSPTSGIATATRALVMMRWGVADSVPSVGQITAAVLKLRANPGVALTYQDLPS